MADPEDVMGIVGRVLKERKRETVSSVTNDIIDEACTKAVSKQRAILSVIWKEEEAQAAKTERASQVAHKRALAASKKEKEEQQKRLAREETKEREREALQRKEEEKYNSAAVDLATHTVQNLVECALFDVTCIQSAVPTQGGTKTALTASKSSTSVGSRGSRGMRNRAANKTPVAKQNSQASVVNKGPVAAHTKKQRADKLALLKNLAAVKIQSFMRGVKTRERYLVVVKIVVRWANLDYGKAFMKLMSNAVYRARMRFLKARADSHWKSRSRVKCQQYWRFIAHYRALQKNAEVVKKVTCIQKCYRGLLGRRMVLSYLESLLNAKLPRVPGGRAQLERSKNETRVIRQLKEVVSSDKYDVYLPSNWVGGGCMFKRQPKKKSNEPPRSGDPYGHSQPGMAYLMDDREKVNPRLLESAFNPIWSCMALRCVFGSKGSLFTAEETPVALELAGDDLYVRYQALRLREKVYGSDHFEVLKMTEAYFECCTTNGLRFLYAGRPKEALEMFKKGDALISSPETFNFPTKYTLLSEMMNNIAACYYRMNKFYEAADCLFRAIKWAKHSQQPHIVAYSSLNLGVTLSRMKKHVQARDYILESLELFKKLDELQIQQPFYEVYENFNNDYFMVQPGSTLSFAVVYNNLAMEEMMLGNTDAAFGHANNALKNAQLNLDPSNEWIGYLYHTLSILGQLAMPFRRAGAERDGLLFRSVPSPGPSPFHNFLYRLRRSAPQVRTEKGEQFQGGSTFSFDVLSQMSITKRDAIRLQNNKKDDRHDWGHSPLEILPSDGYTNGKLPEPDLPAKRRRDTSRPFRSNEMKSRDFQSTTKAKMEAGKQKMRMKFLKHMSIITDKTPHTKGSKILKPIDNEMMTSLQPFLGSSSPVRILRMMDKAQRDSKRKARKAKKGAITDTLPGADHPDEGREVHVREDDDELYVDPYELDDWAQFEGEEGEGAEEVVA